MSTNRLPGLSREATNRARQLNAKAADDWAEGMSGLFDALRRNGFTTYQDIADELNRLGMPTRRERKPWSAQNVYLISRRHRRKQKPGLL